MYRLYNVKKAIGLRFLFFAYSPMMIFFIPRNEFNVYLKQIKVILSAVKKYRIYSLVTNTILFYSL